MEKQELLKLAAQRALVKTSMQNIAHDQEKRANFFKNFKNLFKSQTVGKAGTETGEFVNKYRKKFTMVDGLKRLKDIDVEKAPVEKSFEMSPAGLLGMVAAGLIINEFIKKMFDVAAGMGVKMMEPRYYKKLLESNPKLMEESEEDVVRLWGTLYSSSPNLAKDPVAAGAWIMQNINQGYVEMYGGPPVDQYKTLADIEGSLSKNRTVSNPDADGLITGALTAGGFA